MPKNPTYREGRFTVQAGKVYALNFRDTEPNVLTLISSSNSPVYVSESANVSAETYDIIIPPYGTRIFAKPNTMREVYFFAAADANIFCGSMEMEYDPSMTSQSQEVVSNIGGLLGSVIVNNLKQENPGYVVEQSAASILNKIQSLATEATAAAILAKIPGTIPEYGWLDTDDEPTPLDPTKLAFGVEINTTTHAMTTKYWNGTVWQEVL